MVTTATLIAVEIVRKNPDQVGFAVNPRTPEARISPNAIFSIFLGALAAISESWIRFSHLETVGTRKQTKTRHRPFLSHLGATRLQAAPTANR